ncbi:hypothetical protein HKX48_001841 [Thoreauomyces humboldtii]|nr:hypothetical protein HKX48_001841 [Thoreauomyces humboldtii]
MTESHPISLAAEPPVIRHEDPTPLCALPPPTFETRKTCSHVLVVNRTLLQKYGSQGEAIQHSRDDLLRFLTANRLDLQYMDEFPYSVGMSPQNMSLSPHHLQPFVECGLAIRDAGKPFFDAVEKSGDRSTGEGIFAYGIPEGVWALAGFRSGDPDWAYPALLDQISAAGWTHDVQRRAYERYVWDKHKLHAETKEVHVLLPVSPGTEECVGRRAMTDVTAVFVPQSKFSRARDPSRTTNFRRAQPAQPRSEK